MTKKLLIILSVLLLIFTVSACKKQEQVFNDGEEEKEIVKDEKESLTEDLTGKKKTDSVENVDEGKDESKIELKEEERKEKEVIEERTEEIKKVDTSNWKTYRSEEFGFEFRYPKTYAIAKTKRKFNQERRLGNENVELYNIKEREYLKSINYPPAGGGI